MTNLESLNISGIAELKPIELYKNGAHSIYWLGIPEETAFRCNVYLLIHNNEAVLIDPGNRNFFNYVKERLCEIIDIKHLKAISLSHQDPDVGASIYDWLKEKPDICLCASARTNVLLPHFGIRDYNYHDSVNQPYTFHDGSILKFIEAPFLHFPGAVAVYDPISKYLFSGDIWAALDMDWQLIVDDFEDHIMKMDLFHLDYMASNKAARGFCKKIEPLEINAILPQHGSIISKKYVGDAIKYLSELECGLDLIYPEL